MRGRTFKFSFNSFLFFACSAWSFPDGAAIPTAADITSRLGGKVFSVKLANGSSWRLEYKSNGYFFVDTSTGFRGSGKWHAQDGKLCGNLQGAPESCNEVRVHSDVFHLRRADGEVIQYILK